MSNTQEHMKRQIASAQQLESVVRTMKAQAASSITQYQTAVASLVDYCRTIELGLTACLHNIPTPTVSAEQQTSHVTAIIFGSDQGLVGQFNEQLVEYMQTQLTAFSATKTIFAVGQRAYECLVEAGLTKEKTFEVPSLVTGITPLVGEILTEISNLQNESLLIFYNLSAPNNSYTPTHQQLLPLNAKWQKSLAQGKWPSNNLPEIIGENTQATLSSLIREHLFISIFLACAESLTSENASRLAAMQRAEKNITEMLEELKQHSRSLRQSAIDEELFDVIASYKFGV